MDTSEQYIKMCEKAEEIQKLCEYQRDDIREYGKNHAVWLPRQDQLQEMISTDLNELVKVFFGEMKWGERGNLISKNPMYVIDLKSMEQLWLAFVMRERFNKVWTGEEWEEIG